MRFSLSTSLATQLRDDIRERPLGHGEIRRIEGMWRHNITAGDTDLTTRGLLLLFTLKIDDASYAVAVPNRDRIPGGMD